MLQIKERKRVRGYLGPGDTLAGESEIVTTPRMSELERRKTGTGGKGVSPWPPADECPVHFLLREPLLFSLSADRCFFTFSSFLFLLCTFSYTSSLCLGRGEEEEASGHCADPLLAAPPELTVT